MNKSVRTTNEQFREIYEKSGLTYQHFADLLDVSYYTIRSWLSKPDSPMFRTTPIVYIKLLKSIKL